MKSITSVVTLLLLPLGVVFATGVAACTSSATSAAAADSGPSNTLVCGAGGVKGTARMTDPSSLGAVAGVVITAGSGCTAAVSDDRGMFSYDLPARQVLKIDFSAKGYITEHAEAAAIKGLTGTNLFIFPASYRTNVFTGWTEGSGYVLVVINGDGGDAGPCATAAGATVSIKGHPEIKVGYAADSTTRSPTLTATSDFGVAVLGPVPPGRYEVEATKTGCKASVTRDETFEYAASFDVLANTLTASQLSLSQ